MDSLSRMCLTRHLIKGTVKCVSLTRWHSFFKGISLFTRPFDFHPNTRWHIKVFEKWQNDGFFSCCHRRALFGKENLQGLSFYVCIGLFPNLLYDLFWYFYLVWQVLDDLVHTPISFIPDFSEFSLRFYCSKF